jgi:hypothetical protein
MELPPGVPDPMFMCELALELNMSLAELAHGRGAPMPLHELGVIWPTYFRARDRERKRAEDERKVKG